MDDKEKSLNNMEDEMVLKRGPWTTEEDFKLINYISTHGEGRWNSLSRCAGLQRTGKSCRLRWLNYLRPEVRRGNITLEEQLLILELHSRWGNKWSKIAQYLPGRTDNEIKNYWRTRVQKHAKQLKCDVNSQQFKHTMKYLWMPLLLQKIQSASVSATTTTTGSAATSSTSNNHQFMTYDYNNNRIRQEFGYITPENSSVAVSPVSDLTDYYYSGQLGIDSYLPDQNLVGQEMLPENYFDYNGLLDEDLTAVQEHSGLLDEDLTAMEDQSNFNWFENINGASSYSSSDRLWNDEDFWFLQQNQQLLIIEN